MSNFQIYSPFKLSLITVLAVWGLAVLRPAISEAQTEFDRNSRRVERDFQRERRQRDFNLKNYLTKLDKDKNGFVEPEEYRNERTKRFLRELGINPSGSLNIAATIRKVKSDKDKKTQKDREEFKKRLGSKVNEFGIADEPADVNRFGVEPEPNKPATFSEKVSGLRAADYDADTLGTAKKVLSGYDRDRSGFLEGDEIKRISWRKPDPATSDLNRDGRLSLLELSERLKKAKQSSKNKDGRRQRRRQIRSQEKNSTDAKSNSNSNARSTPRKERFNSSSQGSSAGTTKKKASTRQSIAAKSSNYVNTLLKRYDTNSDLKISKEEAEKMSRNFRSFTGDTNRDGFLSRGELLSIVSGDSKKKSSTSRTSANKRPRVSNNSGALPSTRKSNGSRPTKTTPSGFAKLDADGNGQIEMNEYSSRWDQATLNKFKSLDANEDGIISQLEWK